MDFLDLELEEEEEEREEREEREELLREAEDFRMVGADRGKGRVGWRWFSFAPVAASKVFTKMLEGPLTSVSETRPEGRASAAVVKTNTITRWQPTRSKEEQQAT